MSSHAHINLLDAFNSDDILKIKKEYDEVYKLLSQYKQEYNQLTINEQETAQRLDLYLFQANELKEANLIEDEDSELEKERTQLANFEKINIALEQTRLNSSHVAISYAVFCLKKKNTIKKIQHEQTQIN